MRALTLEFVAFCVHEYRSRNEVLAREGIDTLTEKSSIVNSVSCRNEVLAREGIDTFIACIMYKQ